MASVGSLKVEDLISLGTLLAVGVGSALVGCIACVLWFRREQNQFKKDILNSIAQAGREPEGVFLNNPDEAVHGELIAQFKVNQGRQVVSLLESDGKRFIHVDGELSAKERAKVIHYLKSEGFVS